MTEDGRESAGTHLEQVARGGIINLAGAAVAAVSGFALVLVVTNLFSQSTAGAFFAGTSSVLVLTAIASLGTETGLARFLLRFEAKGRGVDIARLVRVAVCPPMILATVLAFVIFFLAPVLAPILGMEVDQGTTSLRVLSLSLPFITLANLSLAGTRAFGHMKATALVNGVGRSALQPIGVGLAFALGGGLVLASALWVIPFVLAALVAAPLFRRQLRIRSLRYEGASATSLSTLMREFWAFTWPRSITRVSQMVIQRLDIVLVAALLGPREAAIYTGATRFVALGQLATQAIQQVLEPKFTQLLSGDDQTVLKHVFRTAAAWSMALAWPLYIFVAVLPSAYLGLFGSGYATSEATLVVVVMALAMMFGVASGAADTLLLMSGRSKLTLINSLIALGIDVALCFVLIPEWGIVGAAAAWAVAVITRCSLALVQARIALSVFSFGPASGRVAIATLVCLAAPLATVQYLFSGGPALLLATVTLSVCAYAGAIWLWRVPLEVTFFWDAIANRRRRTQPKETIDAP